MPNDTQLSGRAKAASSLQLPQGSLWSLLGRREVKLKGAGSREAGAGKGRGVCMEDGSEEKVGSKRNQHKPISRQNAQI